MLEVVDLRRFASRYAVRSSDVVVPYSRIAREPGGTVIEHDLLGQMPLHVLAGDKRLYVANTVKDLMWVPGYRYEDVQVVRHGTRLRCADDGSIETESTFDYHAWCPRDFEERKIGGVEYTAAYVRARLERVTSDLLEAQPTPGCLLSGGVDSMIVCYLTSLKRAKTQAYTLGLSSKVEDVALASEYAKAFKVDHHIVATDSEDIVEAFSESVWRSEIYHLYNVYCAVGMVLLGRHLRGLNTEFAMSGEGANEAFGDYHNWEVTSTDGKKHVIQHTNVEVFNSPEGRHAYVWGNKRAEARNLFNKQLGTGLAKHGVSRMYKPMYEYGVQLLSPFMDLGVLKMIACIGASELAGVGGKPGFMGLVFAEDIRKGQIPGEFFANRKKTRLQDASVEGRGGITETLLERGFDQAKVIAIFNTAFGANVANHARFVETELL
jgi:asparagine synthetase B (glutamine-hydrolysing)